MSADQNEWEACNCKPTKNFSMVVDGLVENEQYEFRLIAVNQAGESQPSSASDIVLAQDPPGPPVFDMSGVKDVVVRAGDTIEVRIPYMGGFPKPTAEVVCGDRNVFEDERVKIEVSHRKLTVTSGTCR